MQSLSMTHLKSETPLEDIVEFGGAVYSPDTVANDELDEPIDSHVHLGARNTRWLVELDDPGCLTVSPVDPDSARLLSLSFLRVEGLSVWTALLDVRCYRAVKPTCPASTLAMTSTG